MGLVYGDQDSIRENIIELEWELFYYELPEHVWIFITRTDGDGGVDGRVGAFNNNIYPDEIIQNY